MNASDPFLPVSREHPCVICARPDWCRRSRSGGHECHRINEPEVNGLRRMSTTRSGFPVYRDPNEQPAPAVPARSRSPRAFPSAEAAAAEFARWKRGVVEELYAWTDDWFRARIRLPDGKAFCEITRQDGGWVLSGPKKPHVLYRARDLPQTGLVAVCEGEKTCDAGWLIGLPCVTSGASSSAAGADWKPLAGREVLVLPDNDDAGRDYAADVVRRLAGLDPVPSVRVVALPDLAEKEDLHEFVHEHRDSQDAETILAEILALAAAAPIAQSTPLQPAETWPEPQPLPDALPQVQPFDDELLPSSLRLWIRDIAERMQCPPDYPAIAAMIAVAAVVGRKVGIRPKERDDWLVVPNLWGVAIGAPSLLKTPAMQETLDPVRRLEVEAATRFKTATKEHAAQALVAEQRRAASKTQIRKSMKDGAQDVVEIARKVFEGDDEAPVRRRYLVNDTTVEKLGEILNENPNGVLVFRDELIGFLKSLEKEGYESARAFYLEAWNGTGRHTCDRIKRGTVDIEATTISLLGTIQPGPLRAYLLAAVSGGEGADGFIQRFQLAVYPDSPAIWRNVDRWPERKARQKVYDTIKVLDELDAKSIGAEHDDFRPGDIPHLHFSVSAQTMFDAWRGGHEQRLRSGTEHPVMEAHLAKFRSLIPSIALLCHLADGATGPVGVDSLERAIGWGRYLESHARRIYAVTITPDTAEAAELAKQIAAGKLKDSFRVRDVYRRGWFGLGSRDAVLRAVQVLIDLDWLCEAKEPQLSGRPSTLYRVNPRVLRRSAS